MHAAYESVVKEAVAGAELPGFRKGKAPRNLVEPKLDRNQTLNHTLSHLIPKVRRRRQRTLSQTPVKSQIKIVSGKEGEDWIFLPLPVKPPPLLYLKASPSGQTYPRLQNPHS